MSPLHCLCCGWGYRPYSEQKCGWRCRNSDGTKWHDKFTDAQHAGNKFSKAGLAKAAAGTSVQSGDIVQSDGTPLVPG